MARNRKPQGIRVSMIDAAIIINLIHATSNHPDHVRIAADLQKQMTEQG